MAERDGLCLIRNDEGSRSAPIPSVMADLDADTTTHNIYTEATIYSTAVLLNTHIIVQWSVQGQTGKSEIDNHLPREEGGTKIGKTNQSLCRPW